MGLLDRYGDEGVDWKNLNHVAIYQGKNLGDALLATTVVRAVTRVAPRVKVTFFGKSSSQAIFVGIGNLRFVSVRRGFWGGLLMGLSERNAPLDLFIDLQGSVDSAIASRMMSATRSILVGGAKRRWYGYYSHVIPHRRGLHRHIVELNLDCLRRLGLAVVPSDRFPILDHLIVAGSDNGNEDPYLVVHPTSRWLFKTPKPAFWIETIHLLQKQTRFRICLTGVGAGLEGEFIEAIEQACPNLIVYTDLSIKELVNLIAGAHAFLGVDTFSSHLAWTLGKAGLVLFGPSDDIAWGPPDNSSLKVFTSQHHLCRPCNLDGCGGSKRSECLESLNPVDVVDELLQRVELFGVVQASFLPAKCV